MTADWRPTEQEVELGPTVSPVQARRLARTLRRWRERAGYSVERAAEELLCGAGTVSRMETGSSAEPLRVRSALELYGAPQPVIAQMVEAAKQRRRRGVLRRPYYDFVAHTFAEYLDLEAEATDLWCYQSDIVHGLLQTEDYARALFDGATEFVPPAELDKFVSLRMERQARLGGDDPMTLQVIVVEAALRTQVGGPDVLREQLRHLIQVAETVDNVEIRVLPFTAGGHQAVGCNCTILSFTSDEPEVIYSENVVNYELQDDSDHVARVRRIYDQVWNKALDPVKSVDAIRQAATQLPT